MTSPISESPRSIAVLAVLAMLALPGAGLAQVGNENGSAAGIPTLDGFGLASMAGAISIGGAWVLARNRGKRK